MGYRWLRSYGGVNRFGMLRRVERAFAGVPAGTREQRPMFGHTLELDVSRSNAQQLLYVEGERFVEERHLLRTLLKPGMTAVDVGANIGYYLLLIEQAVGPQGRVICIEPSTENLPELQRNIEINRFGNVELHTVALGDHDGETGLRTGINSGVEDVGSAAYTVDLRRLDSLITERVDFIKIDVEGYEGQVLSGAENMLANSRPVMFLELHPQTVGKFGYSIRGILDSLARHYASIELYEWAPDAGKTFTDKFSERYLGKDPLRMVADRERLVSGCDRGEVQHTFWAVCRA